MRKFSGKPCVVEGCKNKVRETFRYCAFHGDQVANRLRKDRSYWKHDMRSTEDGNGGYATTSLD